MYKLNKKIECICNTCNKIFYTFLCYIKRGGGKYCSPECLKNNEKYFWSCIDIKANVNLCWKWKGLKDKKNYGRFYYNKKMKKSHRLAYFLTFPEQDTEENQKLIVRHYVCDNPPCCNPYHLKLGTQQDNIKDKIRKNRQIKGIFCHKAKLDDFDIKQILLLQNILKVKTISEMYKIDISSIYDIFNNKIWKHVSRNNL